jgi:hypothetical protein
MFYTLQTAITVFLNVRTAIKVYRAEYGVYPTLQLSRHMSDIITLTFYLAPPKKEGTK